MAARFSLKRYILALGCLIVYYELCLVPYRVGDYFENIDKFSGDISREDVSYANEHLSRLSYFYDLSKKLESIHLDWLVREYLFKNERFYKGAYLYISKDWGGAINELKKEDGFWAYYIRANARWRQAEEIYANGLNLTDSVKKKNQLKIADDMAKETKEDYLAAIKSDPNEGNESRWNYDLVSDDASRAKALMPGQTQIKAKLGIPLPGGSGESGPEGKDGEGDKGHKPKDLDKKSGNQPGNSDGKPKRIG